MQNERDNAAQFFEYMRNEDCAFSKVSKQIGAFAAVLFYLRQFELWLERRACKLEESAPSASTNTRSPKLPPSCEQCPFEQMCNVHRLGDSLCVDAWRQLRASWAKCRPGHIVKRGEEKNMAKHPLAIAWDEWSQSDEGVRCADATTMGAHAKQSYYLSNRLWRAFQAGIAAQEKLSGAAHTANKPSAKRRKAAASHVG